jgi:hypothetical protein
MSSAPAFLLRCDPYNSRFVLQQRDEDWQLAFDTFEKAYEQAEARAIAPTPLVIYNELGMIILQIFISPFPAELSKARRHWRNLAALPD